MSAVSPLVFSMGLNPAITYLYGGGVVLCALGVVIAIILLSLRRYRSGMAWACLWENVILLTAITLPVLYAVSRAPHSDFHQP